MICCVSIHFESVKRVSSRDGFAAWGGVASGVFVAVVVVGFAAEGFFAVAALGVADFAAAAGFFAAGFTTVAGEDCIGVANAAVTLNVKVDAIINGPHAITNFRILSIERLFVCRSLIMCEPLCLRDGIFGDGKIRCHEINQATVKKIGSL